MIMFSGVILFGLVFLFIAPASRDFIMGSLAGGSAWLSSWAPFSYILLAIVIASPIFAIHLIRSWPVHVEPENPMAKYRRDPLDEVDE